MTAVTVPSLQELFGEPHQRGLLDVRPWAGASEVQGVAAAVAFEGGVVVAELDVPPSSATFCYRWVVSAYPDKRETILRYTSVPTSGPVEFADLTDVNPASFEPSPAEASVLDTVRAELLDGLRLERVTQAEYDAIPEPRPDDVLYVITP